MKIKIILFLIIIFSICSVSYADVIEPGKKDITIYYNISNIQEYPDYIFLIHGNPSPSIEMINSSEFTFYKLSTVSLYAISKAKINENEISKMNDLKIDNFFNNNPNIIKSDIILEGASKSVNINDPLEKIVITLKINSINEKTMNVTKSKVTYIYNDGSFQEEEFTNQNSTPEPSKNSTSFWNYNLFYIILPLIAIMALIIIIISRLKK